MIQADANLLTAYWPVCNSQNKIAVVVCVDLSVLHHYTNVITSFTNYSAPFIRTVNLIYSKAAEAEMDVGLNFLIQSVTGQKSTHPAGLGPPLLRRLHPAYFTQAAIFSVSGVPDWAIRIKQKRPGCRNTLGKCNTRTMAIYVWLNSVTWLQVKVRVCGFGCGIGWTPALSVRHSADEAAYAAFVAIGYK